MFREAIIHEAHPCWGRVPPDNAWAAPDLWAYTGAESLPVEADWLVRRDGLAIGAPRLSPPALPCGCLPVRVHVNIQPSLTDATTWSLPAPLVRAVGAVLGVADLEAYERQPCQFPDFEAPALALVVVVVAGSCHVDEQGDPLPSLSPQEAMVSAVARAARLLCAAYPAPEVHHEAR